MSEDNLKAYLIKQARSLDSLLELTPAKHLFGEDVSDQWQRKKQTPEQKKAARLAKLDPANWKSAKDVYDERSAEAIKKRKRESGISEATEGEEKEESQKSKKQKNNQAQPMAKSIPTEKLTEKLPLSELGNKNAKKRAKKRASRMQKKAQSVPQTEQDSPDAEDQEKRAASKFPTTSTPARSTKQAASESASVDSLNKSPAGSIKAVKKAQTLAATNLAKQNSQTTAESAPAQHDSDEWSDAEDESDNSGVSEASAENDSDANDVDDAHSTVTSSDGMSDILSPPQDSAASSVSSIVPPPQESHLTKKKSSESNPQKPSNDAQNSKDREAARQRLQAQISQFRTQRKADDRPVKSRADLLAQRRQKELEKKAAKKEQRRKEREEEARKQDEEIAKRFSPGGSGSLLASPRSPMTDDNGGSAFNFGRIAFDDGSAFDASSGTSAAKKQKGPADTASALKAAEAKQARVAGLDEQKRQDIAEKDMWLNAKKRAHGERVKDDTSLLKKALKRQEKNKTKSGKEWNERIEGVKYSQEAKQKKRTENLQKRKDEKFSKKTGTKSKKVKRPGFEGSFRSRNGKAKK